MNENAAPEPDKDRAPCPECGALVGGREACQALYTEISLGAYNFAQFAGMRDLAFDAYCMQHLDPYCLSAKSYAAHLTRLCCGLEYAGQPRVYSAIQAWLNGSIPLEKPAAPDRRGTITIADLGQPGSDINAQIIQQWAENVWDAYKAQHSLAHQWIQAALRSYERKR